MIKYIFILVFLFSQELWGQKDSIQTIKEVSINASDDSQKAWDKYNNSLNIKSLIFSGKGSFNGKCHKHNQEIAFQGTITHKKQLSITSSNSLQDKNTETIINKAITEVLRVAQFYYHQSNKKQISPYPDFAIQKEKNIWVFNTYKEDTKKEFHIENKKVRREVILNPHGAIQKIITSLKHHKDTPKNHIQDHQMEIELTSYGAKQKFSLIKGEIINIHSQNKIEFHISFQD